MTIIETFSTEEERTVIDLQAQIGNKRAKIATYLNGRMDNDVKNFWSSRQKRLQRILNTPSASASASASSKAHKNNNTKEIQAIAFHDVNPIEASKFSSSTEEVSVPNSQACSSSQIFNSETIKMTQLPDFVYPNFLSYEQSQLSLNYNPPEKKPFSDSQLQPDFPLESQDFVTKIGDPNFLDVFGNCSGYTLGNAQLQIVPSFFGTNGSFGIGEGYNDTLIPDSFVDDFPPIDMFDHIESLPSSSKWS